MSLPQTTSDDDRRWTAAMAAASRAVCLEPALDGRPTVDDSAGNACPACGRVTAGWSSRYCAGHLSDLRDAWLRWRRAARAPMPVGDPSAP